MCPRLGSVPAERTEAVVALRVSEIFRSIQGESTYQGLPCTFIRLAGCNLHCGYCDTPAALSAGRKVSLPVVLDRVARFGTELIEVTGGEPMLQAGTLPLLRALVKVGHKVLLETNGSIDLSKVPRQVIKIMDIKCPGSGEAGSFLSQNLASLGPSDEIKFVLSDLSDYKFARDMVRKHGLTEKHSVLFSPVMSAGTGSFGREIAEKILRDKLDVRFQIQLHKLIGVR